MGIQAWQVPKGLQAQAGGDHPEEMWAECFSGVPQGFRRQCGGGHGGGWGKQQITTDGGEQQPEKREDGTTNTNSTVQSLRSKALGLSCSLHGGTSSW